MAYEKNSKPRGNPSREEKQPDVTELESCRYRRKRRSRSRERIDRRSRDRYDSSDRRKYEDRESDRERQRHKSGEKKKRTISVERTENRESEDGELKRTSSTEISKNLEGTGEKNISEPDTVMETTKITNNQCYKNSIGASGKSSNQANRKRAHRTDKRESSSDDDDNIPEQYRTSNFSCQTEQKMKS